MVGKQDKTPQLGLFDTPFYPTIAFCKLDLWFEKIKATN